MRVHDIGTRPGAKIVYVLMARLTKFTENTVSAAMSNRHVCFLQGLNMVY